MIRYGIATSDKDLQQILSLQKANLPQNISTQEAQKEGFVTVNHDLDILQKMNQPFPHIVARDADHIIAYALVMQRELAGEIPILFQLFEHINSSSYQGQLLKDLHYFVMGQICIAKGYRGQGVFPALYAEMKRRMSQHYDYIITLIARKNLRSIKAHQKVGFIEVKSYLADYGDEMVVVLWKITP